MENIGVLGGTFNPVHNGHVRLVELFLESVGNSRVIVIPANAPHYKPMRDFAPPVYRLNMCRTAFKGMKNVQVSDMEICADGFCYTADTLTKIKEANPDAALYLIMGSDALKGMLKWYRAADIIALATIFSVARDKDIPDALRQNIKRIEQMGGQAVISGCQPLAVSSTEVRRRIREGASVEGLLPDDVTEYVLQRGLYK